MHDKGQAVTLKLLNVRVYIKNDNETGVKFSCKNIWGMTSDNITLHSLRTFLDVENPIRKNLFKKFFCEKLFLDKLIWCLNNISLSAYLK